MALDNLRRLAKNVPRFWENLPRFREFLGAITA